MITCRLIQSCISSDFSAWTDEMLRDGHEGRICLSGEKVEWISGQNLHSRHLKRVCGQVAGHEAASVVQEQYRDNIPSSGKLSTDLKSFSEFFKLRSYEASSDAKFSIDTLANLLQDAAVNHARAVGFDGQGLGTDESMEDAGIIWVQGRLRIEVDKYTYWNQPLKVTSWIQPLSRLAIRREYIVESCCSGEVVARAASSWFVMNTETRRVSRIPPELLSRIESYFKRGVFALPEAIFKSRLPEPQNQDQIHFTTGPIRPLRTSVDMNKHVNNVMYITWALEALPDEEVRGMDCLILDVEYRNECRRGDFVTSTSNKTGVSNCKAKYYHRLFLSNTDVEVVRGVSYWGKKT